MSDIKYPLLTFLIAMLLWVLATSVLGVPEYLLPKPLDVIQRLFDDRQFLMFHSIFTILITVGGFVLSIAVGVPIAFLLEYSRPLDKALMPWLILSQTFPKVALAPLIVVWFGLGFVPKLLISFLVAFFPIVISALIGLRSLEKEVRELAHSMKVSKFQLFWHFQFPTSLPSLFGGMKVSAAFAVVGAVIAEWVGASRGLGYLLLVANAKLDTSLLFAVLVILMLIGVSLYYAIEFLERKLIPWHVSIRLAESLSGQ
jgi:NitT/TauT family transport system permease protein